MPRAQVRVALAAMLVATVTGCATPTELQFDQIPQETATASTVASPPLDDAESVTRDTARQTDVDDDTTDGGEATHRAVETAFGRLISAWVDCFHRPARCEHSRLTAGDSPERSRFIEAMAYYAGEQIRTKPDEGRLEWGIESISLTSKDRARLLVCEHDSRIFFDSSMASTELGDIIFDTTVWTRRVEWTLATENGEWKLWSRRIERRSPVARFCTP